MRSWALYCQVLLAGAVLLPLRAPAYTVTPSLLTLRTTGDGSSAFLQLANQTMKPVAVELTMHEHHKDIDGQGVTGSLETGDDFIVYPSQLVLLPGDEAAVQVRWIGEQLLDTERAYTLGLLRPRPGVKGASPRGGTEAEVGFGFADGANADAPIDRES